MKILNIIISKLDWLDHLFWLIGWIFICLLKFDIKGVIEMSFWIRIHLTYSCECMGYEKQTFWNTVKNECITILGFVVTLGFLLIVYKFIFLIKGYM